MTASTYQYLNPTQAEESFGDVEVVKEIITLIHQQLNTEIPTVQAFIEQNELVQAKKIIHGWNGSIGHFVLPKFAQQLKQLEQLLVDAPQPIVQSAFTEKKVQLETLTQEIQQYLSRNS